MHTRQHKKTVPTPIEARKSGGKDYAQEPKLPPKNSQTATDTYITKYTSIDHRTANTRRTPTHTYGQLVTVYVRYWRSKPVRKVKLELRKEIAEW